MKDQQGGCVGPGLKVEKVEAGYWGKVETAEEKRALCAKQKLKVQK